MKSFIAALIVMVAVAAGASTILNSSFQKTADKAYATGGARVGDGH